MEERPHLDVLPSDDLAKGGRTMVTDAGADVAEGIRSVLRETLELGDRADALETSTGLFESLVEFDSMAIVTVVLALEERFGITIDDDEIGADAFETFGTLTEFVRAKLPG
jgi:acyl carrier protein